MGKINNQIKKKTEPYRKRGFYNRVTQIGETPTYPQIKSLGIVQISHLNAKKMYLCSEEGRPNRQARDLHWAASN